MNHTQLSRIISYALRHNPDYYGLKLNDEGWVELEQLVTALKNAYASLYEITVSDILQMINESPKKRHEIKGDKIRANYGHRKEIEVKYVTSEPPILLYHGTYTKVVTLILSEGLKHMDRLFVHLSSDIDMAYTVGIRKGKQPAILIIKSFDAYKEGVRFYFAGNNVWLSDNIPSKFIEILNNETTQD